VAVSHPHSINQRLTAHVPQVPPVGDLHRVRRARADAFRVGAGPVSADDLHAGVRA